VGLACEGSATAALAAIAAVPIRAARRVNAPFLGVKHSSVHGAVSHMNDLPHN
jgi:hypothetical protein